MYDNEWLSVCDECEFACDTKQNRAGALWNSHDFLDYLFMGR